MNWVKTRDPRIKKRGETYYARFSKRGIRIEDSLYTARFDVAVDIVNKIERSILNSEDYKEVLSGKDHSLTPLIVDLWPDFMKDKANGNLKLGINKCRDRTLREYINFYELYFKDFWGEKRLDQINVDEWEKYIQYARNKSYKKDKLKIFNHAKLFSGFCTWAVKTEKLLKKPNIYNPDKITFANEEGEQDGIGINLSNEQLEQLRLGSINYESFHLYIIMAQYMGMRSSEITQLKKDRIDLKKGFINLRAMDVKTKQKRSIPIHSEVLKKLTAQYNKTNDPYLFPNRVDSKRPMDTSGFKKPWDKLRVSTKVDCRFHDLRHSCATRMFDTLNPAIACKILGMSLEVAMKVYIHFTSSQLSEAIDQLSLEESK